jgi:ABC-type sugar transport system ATPase subunit
MAELGLREVTRVFRNGVRAVDGVSLDIADGRFAVLVGPSGCGKSTTLRMVAGLEPVDAGEVLIGGRRVNDDPPQRRNIAFVFQNYALYPHMTVAANLGFGLRMRRVPRSEIRERVRETSRILGLEHLLDRYPAQLSGGERQRVALGRATVRDPSVFLLDEPLSNLDAQLRSEMRVELVKIQRRLEATFVFVTHDQVEAMTLADVLAVMRAGVLQQVGPPEEIYAQPANTFVAGFIGSPKMNLISGTIADGRDGPVFSAGSLRLPLPSVGGLPESIVVGLRPEHMRVDPEGEIDLRLDVVESLGSQKFVYGSADGVDLGAAIDPRLHPREGERLRLSIASGALHLFDALTGARLT